MALSIVADPVPTMQALAVRIAKLTPLALSRRCPSSASERPAIALRVVQRSTCPGTLRATRRGCIPGLDPRQGARLYPDVIFLGSALETDTHSSVDATSMYRQCYRWVRYTPYLEDHSISTAENINRAGFRFSV